MNSPPKMHSLMFGFPEFSEPELERKLKPYGFHSKGLYFSRHKTIGNGNSAFNDAIDYVVSDEYGTHAATIHMAERVGFEAGLRSALLHRLALDTQSPYAQKFMARYGQYFDHSKERGDFKFIEDHFSLDKYDVRNVPALSQPTDSRLLALMRTAYQHALSTLGNLQQQNKK